MAIKQQATIEETIEVVKNEEQNTDLYGFEAEYVGGYKTISGKEPREISNLTGYYIGDLELGQTITGYIEVDWFKNEDKDEITGEYSRNYQNIRARVFDIDGDEYVDFYANIPRADENGFITNLNKYFDFFRSGFDLVFSFMRFIDETNVVTADGEEIDRINKVNIVNVAKAIDQHDLVTIKVVKGANEEYNSWIITNMKKGV